jgi:CRISPR-associated protein Csb1
MTAAAALDALESVRYLALEVELSPLAGPTIQLTTFANTGSSFYVAPDGSLSAVVDSVASMANQLELTVWDEAGCEPQKSITPLPWVRVVDEDGAYFTSSRRAAHRLNAHSVMTGTADGQTFEAYLASKLSGAKPPELRRLAEVVWDSDPLSLIHGCWFPGIWDGRARIVRALSARIDAIGVESQAVQVGGQKSADHLSEVATRQSGAEGKTVEGEVPVYMSEVSARSVVASILLDVGLLRSYSLQAERERALIAVGVLMVNELIGAWPRRRSRCVLAPNKVTVRTPESWAVPELVELRDECFARCAKAIGGDSRNNPRDVLLVRKKGAAKGAAG